MNFWLFNFLPSAPSQPPLTSSSSRLGCVCVMTFAGREDDEANSIGTHRPTPTNSASVHSAKTPRHFSHHFPLITNGKRRQLHFFIFPGISKHQHQSQEGQVKFPQTPLAPQTHRDFSRSSSSRRCAFAERKKGEIRTFHYTTHRKRVARRSTVPGTVRLNPFFGP